MKYLKQLLGLCGLLLCLAAGGLAVRAEEQPAIQTKEVDAFLRDAREKMQLPSLTVTLFDRETILFSKGYGPDSGADRIQQIGSTTKSMTALAIMQLAETGKIRLDAPVSDYLPNLEIGDRITVRELLTHTSGIQPNIRKKEAKVTANQGSFQYANTNYSLLGDIIEQVTGQSYETYMAERVFKPLGMTQTTARIEEAKAWGLPDGHKNWFGLRVKSDPEADFPKPGTLSADYGQVAAGYVSSTTHDMAKYLQLYLRQGQTGVIDQASIQQMWTDVVDTPREGRQYGYGWTRSEVDGQTLLFHDGATPSGYAFMFLFPELGIGGVALTNGADPLGQSLWNTTFFDKLTSLARGKKVAPMGQDYMVTHIVWNAICAGLLLIPLLSLLRLRTFRRRLAQGQGRLRDAIFFGLLHVLLPLGLFLALPAGLIGIPVPLALARSALPDLYWTILLSVSLMVAAGLAKVWIWQRARRSRSQTA